MGALLEIGAGTLATIAGAPPGPLLTIPNTIASGLTMGVIAPTARNVQAEAIRRRAEAAELARARAELRAMRAQINPHFLFNALNTIRYFARTDPETARRLLLDLSEVFQRALRSGDFVPLEEEIRSTQAYLALEKARLNDRLQVEWEIGEDVPMDHPVPTLLLQPIAENAVIHGVSKRSEGGRVRISVAREADNLVLRVEDDGPGIPPDLLAGLLGAEDREEGGEGYRAIGLRNVDGRLRVLYGDVYRLRIESEEGRGTRVEMRVPISEEGQHEVRETSRPR